MKNEGIEARNPCFVACGSISHWQSSAAHLAAPGGRLYSDRAPIQRAIESGDISQRILLGGNSRDCSSISRPLISRPAIITRDRSRGEDVVVYLAFGSRRAAMAIGKSDIPARRAAGCWVHKADVRDGGRGGRRKTGKMGG